jgi:hypothetical protein
LSALQDEPCRLRIAHAHCLQFERSGMVLMFERERERVHWPAYACLLNDICQKTNRARLIAACKRSFINLSKIIFYLIFETTFNLKDIDKQRFKFCHKLCVCILTCRYVIFKNFGIGNSTST